MRKGERSGNGGEGGRVKRKGERGVDRSDGKGSVNG